MVKNTERIAKFQLEELKKESISYTKALKFFEGLWQEGIALGVLPPKYPLDGIETDIRIARILNSCTKQL